MGTNRIPFLAGWVMAGRFLRRFRGLWRKAALANLFGGISSGLQLIVPIGTIKIINEVIPTRDYYLLAEISSVIALAAIGAVVCSFFESHFAFLFRERANIKLEVEIFEHVQSQPYQFFKENESAYLMSRLFNDAGTTMDVVTSVTTFGRTLVWLLGGLVLLPFFHLKLGLLIIAVLPVYMGVLWWFNRRTKEAFCHSFRKDGVDVARNVRIDVRDLRDQGVRRSKISRAQVCSSHHRSSARAD